MQVGRKTMLATIAVLIAFVVGLMLGALAYSRDVWPVAGLRAAKLALLGGEPTPYAFDDLGRLAAAPGKRAVPCPPAGPRTAVLLIVGQSNAGNHLGERIASEHGAAIVNWTPWGCFEAASPLLGSTGTSGDYPTLLANRLLSQRVYDSVILMPAAVSSRPIAFFAGDRRYLGHLDRIVAASKARSPPTHVLIHQGEEDWLRRTLEEDYLRTLASLLAHLRRSGIAAPAMLAIASRCRKSPAWSDDNPIRRAQLRATAPGGLGFVRGPDIDRLVPEADRFDGCHFGARAQSAVADAWAGIIAQSR